MYDHRDTYNYDNKVDYEYHEHDNERLNVIERYQKKRLIEKARHEAETLKYPNDVCECLSRPINCVCFKRRCVIYNADGSKHYGWSTPPPSPILKHNDNVKEWGITIDDKVYFRRAADDKRIESKKKIADYAYPHCHLKECKQYPIEMYYAMIESRSGASLPEPYSDEMS